MRPKTLPMAFGLAALLLALPPLAVGQGGFTLDQVLSAPFPSSLVAAPSGARIAWAYVAQGRRGIRVAEAPEWTPRDVVRWPNDDGAVVSVLGFSGDGAQVVFTRGFPYNPANLDRPPRPALFRIPWKGGPQVRLSSSTTVALSPNRPLAARMSGGDLTLLKLVGAARPSKLCAFRGSADSLRWSPDGTQIAVRVRRAGKSGIAVVDVGTRKITHLPMSPTRIGAPVWSPDGRRLAHVTFARRGSPGSLLARRPYPKPDAWSITVADLAPGTVRSSWPEDASASRWARVAWRDEDHLLVLSERDGWRRLYTCAVGDPPVAVSPTHAIVEGFTVDRTRGRPVFVTNALDLDRRHLWTWTPDQGLSARTPGTGIEWSPVITGDGRWMAHLASSARRPAHVVVKPIDEKSVNEKKSRRLDTDLPATFPLKKLVEPKPVIVRAADGTQVHCQLFQAAAPAKRRPAVLFFHGGPIRQMLLGWHYRHYYHCAYALNQYLASQGYVVLSVNFRMGIGYGAKFRDVPDGGPRGASEYQDVLAATKWLQEQPGVDAARIGLWGGSYGGFLTALGLGRNSDLFAAGVDLHGVHDWNAWQKWVRRGRSSQTNALAHKSSPVAALDGWRSPVLLVHGDDDRNVPFSETTQLAKALKERGVPHEVVTLPGEIHSFLLHQSWLRVFGAAAGFLDRRLKQKASPVAPIADGAARYEFHLDGVPIETFTYKPKSYRGERMIIVMHGTLRNADEYRDHAVAMGERFGALVVAPRFDRRRFTSRRYHRGGILTADGKAAPKGEWTYRFIPMLARSVREMEQRANLPFTVIGHSAGGQFVARMSAFQDTGAVRHVAANPGSELFPTRDLPFGYGFGGLPPTLADDTALKRYLAVPLTLYLGTADDRPDEYFDQSPNAMKQGGGRLQRGRACFAAASKLAKERGWPFHWRIVEAKGVGHDHQKMFDHAACEAALFGKR